MSTTGIADTMLRCNYCLISLSFSEYESFTTMPAFCGYLLSVHALQDIAMYTLWEFSDAISCIFEILFIMETYFIGPY